MAMTITQRLSIAVKALLGQVPHDGTGGGGYGSLSTWWLPSAGRDYEADAGDLWMNSAVMTCLAWIWRVAPEARFGVVTEDAEGNEQPVPRHPLSALLASPNPHYSGDALWQATHTCYHCDGNAYWLILRNGGGRPVEVWYVPHWMMEPRWPRDGSAFISHYEYTVNGRRFPLPLEDVVHFRYGIDPRNTRKGLAPMKSALREVNADNMASTYTAAILRNSGAVPVVITPSDEQAEITDEGREQLLELWRQRVAGEGAGQPLIAGRGVRVEKLALTPEEMVLDRIRHVPEARICALMGVKAMVAGLSVGDSQRTYSNLAEAQEQSIETCIIPANRAYADQIDRSLLPVMGNPAREHCAWDYRQMRALQPDQDAMMKRAAVGYQGGILKRAEARAMAGLKFDAADEVYFVEPRKPLPDLPEDEGS